MRRRNYAEAGAYYTHRELGRLVPFDTHMLGAASLSSGVRTQCAAFVLAICSTLINNKKKPQAARVGCLV